MRRITISSGTQTGYQQPGAYKPAPYQPYQYEPLTREVVDGQQNAGETCINICMPSCESQCIQKSTTVPTMPQHNGPIPVVQSQVIVFFNFSPLLIKIYHKL